MKGLSWLKVDGSILYLHQDVIPKSSVEWLEFCNRLLGAIILIFIIVNESAPNHNATMRGHSVSKHVRTICMRAVIGLWSGLAFGISFDKETAEVRYQFINFIHSGLPPGNYFWIKRIGRLQFSDFNRSAESRR